MIQGRKKSNWVTEKEIPPKIVLLEPELSNRTHDIIKLPHIG